MPRPQIKLPPKAKAPKAPKGAPQPKHIGKTGITKPVALPPEVDEEVCEEEGDAVARAREAVQKYEAEHNVLRQMRNEWETNFEDAYSALQEVNTQKDYVEETIKAAKPLVAKAKMTIGDFKVQRKYSSAGYDNTAITNLVVNAGDRTLLLEDLIRAGLVNLISVDSAKMISWCAQNPEVAERFKDAWKDEDEMTPAVTVPKV